MPTHSEDIAGLVLAALPLLFNFLALLVATAIYMKERTRHKGVRRALLLLLLSFL